MIKECNTEQDSGGRPYMLRLKRLASALTGCVLLALAACASPAPMTVPAPTALPQSTKPPLT